jgi:putative SOS response-associated peptidase YedK
VPVDGFFEWKAIKGQKATYAIAMKDGASGEWIRTFAIITTASNELTSQRRASSW